MSEKYQFSLRSPLAPLEKGGNHVKFPVKQTAKAKYSHPPLPPHLRGTGGGSKGDLGGSHTAQTTS